MDNLSIDKYISGLNQKFKQFRLRYLTFGRSDYVTVSKKLGIFGLWLLEKSFKLVAIVAAGVVLSANGPFTEKLKTGFSSLSGALRKLFEFPAEIDRMGTIVYDYNHLTVAQFNSQYGSEAIDSLLWNLNAGIDYLILVYQNITTQPVSTLVACALAFGTFWILSRVLRFYRQKGRGTWLVRLERRLGEKIFKMNRFAPAGTGLEDSKSNTSADSKVNGKSTIDKYGRRRLRISPVATEIASNSKKSGNGSKVDGYLSKAKSNSVSPSKSGSGAPSKKSADTLAKKKKMARKIAQLKNKPKSDNPALYRRKTQDEETEQNPAIKPAETVLAVKPKPASPDLESGYELKESNRKPVVHDLEKSDPESLSDQSDSYGQEENETIKAETSMQEMKMETVETETDSGVDLNNQNDEPAVDTEIQSSTSEISPVDSGESEEEIQAEQQAQPEKEMNTAVSTGEKESKADQRDMEVMENEVSEDVKEEENSAEVHTGSTETVDSEDQSTPVQQDERNRDAGNESEDNVVEDAVHNGNSDQDPGLSSGDIVEAPVSQIQEPEIPANGEPREPENRIQDETERPVPEAESKPDDADVIQMNGNGELDDISNEPDSVSNEMDSSSNENEAPEKQDPEPARDSEQEPQADKEQQDQKEESPGEKKKSGSPYNSTSTANIKSLQSAIRQARSS